jgi:hypothetical protein
MRRNNAMTEVGRCAGHTVDAAKSEAWVLSTLLALATQPEALEAAYRDHLARVADERPAVDPVHLQKQLAQLGQREALLIEDKIEARMSGREVAAYDLKLNALNEQRKGIRAELAAATETRAPGPSISSCHAYFAETCQALQAALHDPDIVTVRKHELLALVVRRITFTAEGDMMMDMVPISGDSLRVKQVGDGYELLF